MQIDLSGKTAIVTGSTAGIGLAIAAGLARAAPFHFRSGQGGCHIFYRLNGYLLGKFGFGRCKRRVCHNRHRRLTEGVQNKRRQQAQRNCRPCEP